MAKIKELKGIPVEEVAKMPLDEFAEKICRSNERRTLKRMGVQTKMAFKSLRGYIAKNKANPAKAKPWKTHYRHMIIVPEMLGLRVAVYNGKEYKIFEVLPEMLGKRLGEFSFTCGIVRHSGPGVGATKGSKSVDLK